MERNRWFLLTVRSIAALLLFIAAGVVISMLNPVVSPIQQDRYMMGMMGAITNSMMGSMMKIALVDGWMNFFLFFLALTFLGIIPLSILIGLQLRKWRMTHEKE